MGFLSMLLLFFTLDSIQLTQKRKKLNLPFSRKKNLFLETMKQLLKKSLEVLLSLKDWKYIDQFFLIPLTMWTTIQGGFLTAQFTRVRNYFHSKSNLFLLPIRVLLLVLLVFGKTASFSFLKNKYYFSYVGLVMLCNGICQVLSCYIFGRLVKYTGRSVVFIIAALINYAMIILMFLWEPQQSQMVLLFVIAGFWGVADAVWSTQVIGILALFCIYLRDSIHDLCV